MYDKHFNSYDVLTQKELDSIPDSFDGEVNICFGTIENKAHIYNSYKNGVNAFGNFHVVAHDETVVYATGETVVESIDATVTVSEKATCYAYNYSDVFAYGNAHVEAHDKSDVNAYGDSTVLAYAFSSITLFDNATAISLGERTDVIDLKNVDFKQITKMLCDILNISVFDLNENILMYCISSILDNKENFI